MKNRRFIFATSNEGKIREASIVLSAYGIQIQPIPFSFREPITGSISDVAWDKLYQVLEIEHQNVLVEDSGIFFEAYHQFPGVLSKRVFEGIGYEGIDRLLADQSRKAWFEGAVAVSWQGEVKVFTAKMNGHIIPLSEQTTITPEPGLPFDPIFVPEGETQVLRQLPMEKRLKYSYRKKALVKMVHWIEQHCSNG